MNDKIKRRLYHMEREARGIINSANLIIQDLEDVAESDDLMIIESAFERIHRAADEAIDYVRNTYDEFEEEE